MPRSSLYSWIICLAIMSGIMKSEALFATTTAADTTQCNKVFAKFTFDYGVKGVFPVDMNIPDHSRGNVIVEIDPEHAENQWVQLKKNSPEIPDQPVMYKDFIPVTQGTVSVEAKLRFTDFSGKKEFTLFADTSAAIAGVIIDKYGRMSAIYNSKRNARQISSCKINQWYTVRLILNLSSRSYLVEIDGKKVTPKPLTWKNQSSVPGQFQRMMFRNSGNKSADIYYVDNITILTTTIPGLVYNSGTNKAISTSRLLIGRTCPTRYFISLPVGWTPAKKWPVFIFNIRAGFAQAPPYDGPQIFAEKRGNMPFIIVSVKMKNKGTNESGYSRQVLDYCNATSDMLFDEIAVVELFQQIKEDYNGEDKFYWDGFSASGHAFWALVMWRPEFIAAACGSACAYLGNGGPNPSDLGRGMTSKGVSNAPERINLPVKQYLGELDEYAKIYSPTWKGWTQFNNAKATCEAHGYTNVSYDILPGVGHQIHYDAELAYFYAHYCATHHLKQ